MIMLCNSMIQQKKVTDSGLQFFLMVIIFLIYINYSLRNVPYHNFKEMNCMEIHFKS